MNIIYKLLGFIFGFTFLLIGIGVLLIPQKLYFTSFFLIVIGLLLFPPLKRFFLKKINLESPLGTAIFTTFLIISGWSFLFLTNIDATINEKNLAKDFTEQQDSEESQKSITNESSRSKEEVLSDVEALIDSNEYASAMDLAKKHLATNDQQLRRLYDLAKSELKKVEDDVREQEILDKLKGIPVKKYQENLTLYRELDSLNPDNEKYQRKIEFYAQKMNNVTFDPNAALLQKKEQEKEQQKSTQVTKEQSIYKQYRNQAEVNINNDGTVTIGRMQWMRCSLGQRWDGRTCQGDPTSHKMKDALDLPKLMNTQGGFAGYTDWRLPTIGELATLRQCSSGRAEGTVDLPGGQKTFRLCGGESAKPTIDANAFPNISSHLYYFWSKTANAQFSNHAWGVNFSTGFVDNRVNEFYGPHVRLVRVGQ